MRHLAIHDARIGASLEDTLPGRQRRGAHLTGGRMVQLAFQARRGTIAVEEALTVPGTLATLLLPHREAEEAALESVATLDLAIPLILIAQRVESPRLLSLTRLLDSRRPGQHEALHSSYPAGVPSYRALQAWLARQPGPSPARVAGWLCARLNRPAAVPWAVRAIAPSAPGAGSARTLYRRVRDQFLCRPSDLARLARLALLRRPQANLEALASIAETTTTRLRQRVRRGLGISLAEFNQLSGWTWVLEAAVRHGLGAGGWGLGAGGWGLAEGNHPRVTPPPRAAADRSAIEIVPAS